jgi:hypothetical protein
VPHPFRFFLRKGWDTNKNEDYTISENALILQLQIAFAEGAGGFIPLKNGCKEQGL